MIIARLGAIVDFIAQTFLRDNSLVAPLGPATRGSSRLVMRHHARQSPDGGRHWRSEHRPIRGAFGAPSVPSLRRTAEASQCARRHGALVSRIGDAAVRSELPIHLDPIRDKALVGPQGDADGCDPLPPARSTQPAAAPRGSRALPPPSPGPRGGAVSVSFQGFPTLARDNAAGQPRYVEGRLS
jgi:hypothetical protein